MKQGRSLWWLCVCWMMCSCAAHQYTTKMEQEFMLDGKISRADLKKDFPWFDANYKKYVLNDTAVTELKPFAGELKVMLVMGTWCSDSKEHVPEFFKVADAIGLKDTQVEMIAVNRKKQSTSVDVAPLKIEFVPTFIFFRDGRQIGSIVEDTHENMEKDMLHIIRVAK